MAVSDRSDDERLLLMLQMRARGFSSRQVGECVGRECSHVRTATNRVRAADEACEGRKLEGYWT